MRLCKDNLAKEYPNLGKRLSEKSVKTTPLLQNDYGEANDCTLTSICYIFGADKYDLVETIARKYGYRGEVGTNPLFVKRIILGVAKKLGIKMTVYACYGKNICWCYETVKRNIDSGNILLLNLWDDGRKYYHNHTVVIVGYAEYEGGKFLLINDNWSKVTSYIDYNKLSVISSINYIKE